MEVMLEHESGLAAKIISDEDCSNPWADDDGIVMVVLHRNYTDPAKGKCGHTPEEVEYWCLENKDEWFITGLWMYDHSGVMYAAGEVNPFSCKWDSGRVGIIALKKTEWGAGVTETDEQRKTYADEVCEEYTKWANGDCWGYQVCRDGEEISDGACWGYVGIETAKEAAKEAMDDIAKLDAAKQKLPKPRAAAG